MLGSEKVRNSHYTKLCVYCIPEGEEQGVGDELPGGLGGDGVVTGPAAVARAAAAGGEHVRTAVGAHADAVLAAHRADRPVAARLDVHAHLDRLFQVS